jgi:hypothetical protein
MAASSSVSGMEQSALLRPKRYPEYKHWSWSFCGYTVFSKHTHRASYSSLRKFIFSEHRYIIYCHHECCLFEWSYMDDFLFHFINCSAVQCNLNYPMFYPGYKHSLQMAQKECISHDFLFPCSILVSCVKERYRPYSGRHVGKERTHQFAMCYTPPMKQNGLSNIQCSKTKDRIQWAH